MIQVRSGDDYGAWNAAQQDKFLLNVIALISGELNASLDQPFLVHWSTPAKLLESGQPTMMVLFTIGALMMNSKINYETPVNKSGQGCGADNMQ